MQRRIQLSELAEVEFNESIEFYERRQNGLGVKFGQAITAKMEAIRKNPDGNRIRFLGWREAAVGRRFPYNILSKEVIPDFILVSAIFHTSRNPRKNTGAGQYNK